ncbi:class I SAM-dependent methyltransferase [Desulfuromonas acetoxidans]|uniref:tRNA (mnm(5)s(2)U34)-methyltransferase n=1 Tax=Desulfuromonas acetoxidans TaxID=891 RepID=UPI00292E85BD|nr:class I SAM-dependent methyltransferase [Desulfuromonas acetoxidans]
MKTQQPLTDMARWSHTFAAEVLEAGDLAIDLTAGRGKDCLHLARCVDSNNHGTVLAFDIQHEAIQSTTSLLAEQQIKVATISRPQQVTGPGVFLIQTSHEQLSLFSPRQAKVIMANLGYLPGGDHAITTRADSTLKTIKEALTELLPGGRLILVVYTGHEGAQEESQAITTHLADLHPRHWHIITMRPFLCHNAPYLLVVEKRQQPATVRERLLQR